MNLLIVDDDVIAVKGLNSIIKWKDYGIDSVFSAYDAAQGYDLLHQQPIDIVLCDIEMPLRSGLELIESIRAEGNDVEIIFLTCHAKFQYAQEAIRLGCDNYLLRPMPFDEIAEAVHKVVLKLEAKRYNTRMKEFGEHWVSVQAKAEEQPKPSEESEIHGPDSVQIVADAENFIMENLSDEDLTVAMVAEHCHFTGDYLNRMFKQQKGMSLQKFIINHRMSMAAFLLENNYMTAAAVAEKVGYKNYAYFSTQFKKMYGCIPSEYKAVSNKQGNING